jgi:hypothetical protein
MLCLSDVQKYDINTYFYIMLRYNDSYTMFLCRPFFVVTQYEVIISMQI